MNLFFIQDVFISLCWSTQVGRPLAADKTMTGDAPFLVFHFKRSSSYLKVYALGVLYGLALCTLYKVIPALKSILPIWYSSLTGATGNSLFMLWLAMLPGSPVKDCVRMKFWLMRPTAESFRSIPTEEIFRSIPTEEIFLSIEDAPMGRPLKLCLFAKLALPA